MQKKVIFKNNSLLCGAVQKKLIFKNNKKPMIGFSKTDVGTEYIFLCYLKIAIVTN